MDIKEAYPRENEVPFDSERKRMITIHDVATTAAPTILLRSTNDKHKNWDVIAVKGAPDMVLDLCTQYQDMDDKPSRWTTKTRKRILAANDAMTKDALRVLGLAYRLEKDVPDNPEAGQSRRP